MVDQQCRESKGKAKIEGYMSVSDEEAHHPLSTGIVTVLSHFVTRECWHTEGKADGGEEGVAQENVADKVGSNRVSHKSGSSEEDEDDEKEDEGELEQKEGRKCLGRGEYCSLQNPC